MTNSDGEGDEEQHYRVESDISPFRVTGFTKFATCPGGAGATPTDYPELAIAVAQRTTRWTFVA